MKYSAADYFNSLSPVKDDLTKPAGAASKAGRCHCCPYGYHIDLDFLRYCQGLVKGSQQESATLRRLKQSKRERRRETHSMEVMLGIVPQAQNGSSNVTELLTKNDVIKVGPAPPPRKNSLKHLHKHLENQYNAPDIVKPFRKYSTQTKSTFSEANDALQEAMQDFENTLESSQEDSKTVPSTLDLLQHSSFNQKGSLSQRLGVSPAEANTAMASLLAQSAVDRVRSASVTRSNSLPRYFPDESPHSAWFSKVRPSQTNGVQPSVAQPHTHLNSGGMTLKDALASLESARGGSSSVCYSNVPTNSIPDDISVTSAASQLSTSTLQSIRDQMATGLSRLRELEFEVRNIPHLQREVDRLRLEKTQLQQIMNKRNASERSDDESDRTHSRLLVGSNRNRKRSPSPIRVNLDEFCSYRRARRGSISDCSDTESVTSEHRATTREMSSKSTTTNQLFISETADADHDDRYRRKIGNANNISKLSINRNKRDASTSCRVLTRDVGVHHAVRTRSVGVVANISQENDNSIRKTSIGSLSSRGMDEELSSAKAKLLSQLGRQNSGIINRLSAEIQSTPPILTFDNSTNTIKVDVKHNSTMTESVKRREQKINTLLSGYDVVSLEATEREFEIKLRERIENEKNLWRKEQEDRMEEERRNWENRTLSRIRNEVEKERLVWTKESEERFEREKRMWQRDAENDFSMKTKKSYQEDLEQAVNDNMKQEKREWERISEEKLSSAREEWEAESKLKVEKIEKRLKSEETVKIERMKEDFDLKVAKIKKNQEVEMKEIIERETEKIYQDCERKFDAMKDEYEEDLSDKFENEMRKARVNYEVQVEDEVKSKISYELEKAQKVWEISSISKKPQTRDREIQVTFKETPPKCEKCSVSRKSVGVSWDKVTDVICDTCKDKKFSLKPITKNCYIQTEAKKLRVASCQVEERVPNKRDVGTNTSMILPLKKEQIASANVSGSSPAITPDCERKPFGVNICDKCNATIKSVAKDFVGITVGTNTIDGPIISLPPNSENSKIPRLVDPFKIDSPPLNNAAAGQSGQTPDLLSSSKSITRHDSSSVAVSTQKVPFNRQQTYTKFDDEEQSPTANRKMSSFNEEEEDCLVSTAPKQLPVPTRPLTNTFRREKSSPEITSTKKQTGSVWEKEMMAFNKGKGNSSSKSRSPSPPKPRAVPSIVRTSPPPTAAEQSPPKDEAAHQDFDSDGEGSIATIDNSSVAGSYTSQKRKSKLNRGVRAALKVLNDSIGKPVRSGQQLSNALNIIQRDWFRVSSQNDSDPHRVEDYLDIFEMQYSKGLLHRVVNLADVNGNTAMHYAVSHGNFDVVSILLDSKVCSVNQQNKAGYTATMLVSLAPIKCVEHAGVVERLYSLSDVNVRAHQHGQTALMLAVSHGRLDTVKLLVTAGADVNIQDDDGSTALMCAAEHGHLAIVSYLLQSSDTDAHLVDNDGSSALAIAVEAGHKDVGVVLYKHMNLAGRGSSPYSSLRGRGRIPNISRSSMNTPPPRLSAPPSPGRSRRSSRPASPPGSVHNSPHARKRHSSSASLSNLNL